MFGCFVSVVMVLFLACFVAFLTNPSRRWNIDRNVRKIVNSKEDLEISIFSESKYLYGEYCWQLKHYPDVSCYIDPSEPYIIILSKKFPKEALEQAES